MIKKISILSVLGLTALVGCKGEPVVPVLFDYPELSVSSELIEFGDVDYGEAEYRTFNVQNLGELPMGVSAVYQGAGFTDSFSVFLDKNSLLCPEVDDTGLDASATAKDSHTTTSNDTGSSDTGGGGGSSDTGGGGGTSDTEEVDEDVFILGPECSVSISIEFSPVNVGDVFGSVIIETSEQSSEDEEPEWFADLDTARQIVYMSGTGVMGRGLAVVQPRLVDFGHVWTGEEVVRYVEVSNGGDGLLELQPPTLSDNCDEAFSIAWSYPEGLELEPETSSLIELLFVPVDQSSAFCTVIVGSDDADNPEITVTLQGNTGVDPDNQPPTISLYSPEPGYMHTNSDPLIVELQIFDVNQPATSLLCKVKSMFLMDGVSVANCKPSEDSGHVVVEVDTNNMPAGVDTLMITVTDASEVTAYASVPVLIRADFPSSDDDGDGFGDAETGEMHDCDDQNPDVYPMSSELADGVDNDCDTLVDEGTVGYDDDGDTFSEDEGDCNDKDSSSYPGAPEMADHADNNCDGVVDEGTSLYDDDGDGYSEVNNDCDDSDFEVNPGALELCDGIDNNCNGLQDSFDNCTEIDTDPVIIGGVHMARTAVEEGETLELSMLVYDADGQDLSWAWSVGSEGGEIDDPTAEVVNWTAPDLYSTSRGQIYSVYVVVQDEDGNQVWEFAEIAVYPTNGLNDEQYVRLVVNNDPGGCTSVPAAPIRFGAVMLGVGAVLLRRRS